MIGEVCECKGCHAQLEVASVSPLVLEPLAKVEEDEEDFADF
jgi:lysine biosynthesis protein LysW